MLALFSESPFTQPFIACWPAAFHHILQSCYNSALKGEKRNFIRILIPSSLAVRLLHHFQPEDIYTTLTTYTVWTPAAR